MATKRSHCVISQTVSFLLRHCICIFFLWNMYKGPQGKGYKLNHMPCCLPNIQGQLLFFFFTFHNFFSSLTQDNFCLDSLKRGCYWHLMTIALLRRWGILSESSKVCESCLVRLAVRIHGNSCYILLHVGHCGTAALRSLHKVTFKHMLSSSQENLMARWRKKAAHWISGWNLNTVLWTILRALF